MKQKMNNYKSYTNLPGIVIGIYISYIFLIYPFVMHKGFLDITQTKLIAFLIPTWIAGVFGIWMFVRLRDRRKYIFLLTGLLIVISCLCSEYRKAAWTGDLGRKNGGILFLTYILALITVIAGGELKKIYLYFFSVSSTLIGIIAILNFFEVDILNTLSAISKSQRHIFITTIGNTNQYFAFLSLSISVMTVLFIIADSVIEVIITGAMLFIQFMAMVADNCNTAYLILFSVIVLTPLLLREKKHIIRVGMVCIIQLTSGILMGFLMKQYEHGEEDFLTTVFTDIRKCMVLLLVVIAFMVLSTFFYNTKWTKIFITVDIVVCALILSTIVIVNVFKFTPPEALWDFVVFDDNWGDHRGYIWKKGVEFYAETGLKNKLFGVGPDCIYPALSHNMTNDSLIYDGQIFNNLHNVYLQDLVTIGLAGVASCIVSIILLIKNAFDNAKDNRLFYCIILACGCYMIQAVFNMTSAGVNSIFIVLLGLSYNNIVKKN